MAPMKTIKATRAKAMTKGAIADVRRVPLAAREVYIIRRLKTVLKLPVGKIALAVARHKKTVYSALDKKWKASKRGRPNLSMPNPPQIHTTTIQQLYNNYTTTIQQPIQQLYNNSFFYTQRTFLIIIS